MHAEPGSEREAAVIYRHILKRHSDDRMLAGPVHEAHEADHEHGGLDHTPDDLRARPGA